MKKVIVSAGAIAMIAGMLSFAGTTEGQTTDQSKSKSQIPHKVGLIDMAHVFKHYKKFEALREELKSDIEGSDQKARQMAEQIQSLDEQLKSGQLKPGSEEHSSREEQLIRLNSEFEGFRKKAQREFLRKESQIYKTIYLEVADAVERYAYHYKYTLIMRFDRSDLDSTADPQEVLQRMNQQVVYHRGEDDITLSVLDYLNNRYESSAGTGKPAAPRTGQAPGQGSRN